MKFTKNKKAQGISLNVIIIAVLALLVLVILIAIFGSKIRSFVTGVDTESDIQGKFCLKEGGSCAKRTIEGEGESAKDVWTCSSGNMRTGDWIDCPGDCCY